MFLNRYHELKHVVIVGDGDYIEREWDTLATLPKVYFLYFNIVYIFLYILIFYVYDEQDTRGFNMTVNMDVDNIVNYLILQISVLHGTPMSRADLRVKI